MISYVSPEIITRNLLFMRAKISDITYIKFEFVCQLCKGGTLLSSARCINNCLNPRPLMKLFMRVVVTDEAGSEAQLSLTDTSACQAFGIDISNIDVFKTHFFLHGVFFYPSRTAKPNPEYLAVIQFFKTSQSLRKLAFLVIPFCRVGYDDMNSKQEN